MNCPLCKQSSISPFHSDKRRNYLRCENCYLIFADQSSWPTATEEKGQYDFHVNSPDDLGYRKFLSRMMGPLAAKLAPNSKGLDFGCGPGPTLSLMFEEAGHTVALYDKYYADNIEVFNDKYDFITTTEVIEHLYFPFEELERLVSILKPGGYLGIMTKLARDHDAFVNWHYKNDPTHVCFYSRETFEWIANKWDLELEFFGKDVMILKAPIR